MKYKLLVSILCINTSLCGFASSFYDTFDNFRFEEPETPYESNFQGQLRFLFSYKQYNNMISRYTIKENKDQERNGWFSLSFLAMPSYAKYKNYTLTVMVGIIPKNPSDFPVVDYKIPISVKGSFLNSNKKAIYLENIASDLNLSYDDIKYVDIEIVNPTAECKNVRASIINTRVSSSHNYTSTSYWPALYRSLSSKIDPCILARTMQGCYKISEDFVNNKLEGCYYCNINNNELCLGNLTFMKDVNPTMYKFPQYTINNEDILNAYSRLGINVNQWSLPNNNVTCLNFTKLDRTLITATFFNLIAGQPEVEADDDYNIGRFLNSSAYGMYEQTRTALDVRKNHLQLITLLPSESRDTIKYLQAWYETFVQVNNLTSQHIMIGYGNKPILFVGDPYFGYTNGYILPEENRPDTETLQSNCGVANLYTSDASAYNILPKFNDDRRANYVPSTAMEAFTRMVLTSNPVFNFYEFEDLIIENYKPINVLYINDYRDFGVDLEYLDTDSCYKARLKDAKCDHNGMLSEGYPFAETCQEYSLNTAAAEEYSSWTCPVYVSTTSVKSLYKKIFGLNFANSNSASVSKTELKLNSKVLGNSNNSCKLLDNLFSDNETITCNYTKTDLFVGQLSNVNLIEPNNITIDDFIQLDYDLGVLAPTKELLSKKLEFLKQANHSITPLKEYRTNYGIGKDDCHTTKFINMKAVEKAIEKTKINIIITRAYTIDEDGVKKFLPNYEKLRKMYPNIIFLTDLSELKEYVVSDHVQYLRECTYTPDLFHIQYLVIASCFLAFMTNTVWYSLKPQTLSDIATEHEAQNETYVG